MIIAIWMVGDCRWERGACTWLARFVGMVRMASVRFACSRCFVTVSRARIYEWPNDPRTGATTVNIGLIKSGQAQNAWAAEAEANMFIRVTTSVADILQRLTTIVNGRIDVEVVGRNEPVTLSDVPLDNIQTDQAAFNTDLPYYNRVDSLKGKFLFGAGSIKNAHSKDEFMPKAELVACRDTLVRLVTKLLL